MIRFKSIDEFHNFQGHLKKQRSPKVPTIIIPAGTCALTSGAEKIIHAAQREILAKNLAGRVALRITGCHGFCQMEPSVLVEPYRTFYPEVGAKEMVRIVNAVAQGKICQDLLFKLPGTGAPVEKQDDIPFFSKQIRRVLSSNEKVDPTKLETFIEAGGYATLAKALARDKPEWIVNEVKQSGLRGRGGGGFPTGLKWQFLASRPAINGKVLVCNADEGDPGAYMDRSVLEGNPHSIIEGMLIGARGTGATEGVIYVRKEYPLAIKHLVIALKQARECGLLGKNILGTGFSFDIEIVKGAGAFVCGEETSLIRSIEGKTGEPRQRPPFPVEKGVNGKPTAINNVETWANIPIIIRDGAETFASIGTKNSPGTKIFSLVGKIKNTGLVEVPMGISIKEIVYDIGGGPAGKARIKAVQTGGPSGGCIPAEKFDLPIDYDSLSEAGSIMGSGGMIVMDGNTCMVDVARYFMKFLKDESCGKCFTCRKGTQRMYEILDDISRGMATLEQVELLKELAEAVKDTTMCGLGQTASNPVLSTLRYFKHEYERHVMDKKCDAFVCKSLVGASCQFACPLDTEVWRYVALIEKKKYREAYQVIREANPFPSICARVCDRKCEQRCQLGVSGGEPVAIRTLKRFITDRVAPSVYKPAKSAGKKKAMPAVAVIGAGPAGISAAHYLSLSGYKVTLFEAEKEIGGMLVSCIPAYRLPHEVVRREIKSLMNSNIHVECSTMLGRDMTIDDLFKKGFKAVFLSTGAHKSWKLNLKGENMEGIYPSMQFLKAFNLRGEELANGRVGIIGGGNSAVDAARVAIRQKHVKSVTLLYRRTSQEMPAYAEEVDAAVEEGIKLETLVSPVRILHVAEAMAEGVKVETFVSPIKIRSKGGHFAGIECIRNKPGEVDSSGRRKPEPIPGTEFTLPLDTLIVAIGERPDSEHLLPMGIELDKSGRPLIDTETFVTSRPDVFAAGDLVTGPNTVVDAIAAGKKAAGVIDRHFRGKELKETPKFNLPRVFVEPRPGIGEETGDVTRLVPPVISAGSRKKNFTEVEKVVSVGDALREARRCLRCDLEFTRKKETVKTTEKAV
ncbi:MAG: NADH-ubiquinone oxidoreductase-F iron-sulfur binding region domain-containing protein [Kiritimatiellae bacterium]|nr:NADH-ubiquinone oxidoreductase-F iron-sulfur binding region domain-containing protein [Kiritimatiellia bacterium]MDD5522801.1 NADH-ubiquinone oxidoreductase-F iron-sulfur binding region domain-containing protein [Kiritimatiellia bacterium]